MILSTSGFFLPFLLSILIFSSNLAFFVDLLLVSTFFVDLHIVRIAGHVSLLTHMFYTAYGLQD